MASGKIVGIVERVMYPAASFAVPAVRAGGSTPAERVSIIASFDDASDEYIDLYCRLIGYAGGGLTVRMKWMAASATTGDALMGAAIRRIADDAEDVDGAHTYDFNLASFTAPSASGEFGYDAITFTDGADMDSLANNEAFILRIMRDGNGTGGTDDMAGDMQLVLVDIEET